MKIKKGSKGYVLIELILVMTISVIMLFLLVSILKYTKKINYYYNDKIEIEENAKNIEDTIKIELKSMKKIPLYEVKEGECDSENFKPAKGIFYQDLQIVNGKVLCYNERKELKIQSNNIYIVNLEYEKKNKYQIGSYVEEMRILKYKNKDYFYIKLIMKKGNANYIRKFKVYCY